MSFENIDLTALFSGDMTHDEIQSFYRSEEAPTVGKGDIIYLGQACNTNDNSEILSSVLNDSERYFECEVNTITFS